MEACTCQLCDAGLGSVSDLMRHILLHLGQEPHNTNLKKNFGEYINEINVKLRRYDRLKQRPRPTLTNTGQKFYKCNLCDKIFKGRRYLVCHTKVHTGEKPYESGLCDKAFTRQSHLSEHSSQHSGNRQRCDLCGKAFACASDLMRHCVELHTDQRPFKCGMCDKAFKRNEALKLHLSIHTSQKSFKCEICQKEFTRSAYLARHCLIHKSIKSNGEISAPDSGFSNVNNVKFHRPVGLKRHSLTNTEQKPYTCDLCGKTFQVQRYLTCHRKLHNKGKTYKCDFCDKSFSRYSYLFDHRSIHTGNRPISNSEDISEISASDSGFSNVNNVKFHRPVGLKQHSVTNTEQKSYTCDLCGKTFKQQRYLTCHRKLHNKGKTHKCDFCDKSFSHYSNLFDHRSLHTGNRPYRCDLCDKAFACSSELSRHCIIHTDQRPYKCDMCDQMFKLPATLKGHLVTHTSKALQV